MQQFKVFKSIAYRINRKCFEVHYPCITKPKLRTSITLSIDKYGLISSFIYSIILGFIANNILDPQDVRNEEIMKRYKNQIIDYYKNSAHSLEEFIRSLK